VSRQNAETPHVRFPNDPPDRPAVEHSLALLNNWGAGTTATAIVMAGLLPFAIAWHLTYLAAIAASMIAAVILALSCHLASAGSRR
jgi:hypothetical protein